MPIFLLGNKKTNFLGTPLTWTVFTQSIGTPYLLTILVLKFEIVHSTVLLYVWQTVQTLIICHDLHRLIWV